MCTVTFIPTAEGFYLTSNRDESAARSLALPPRVYTGESAELIYPKDPDAGGSWIALKDKGEAAVLLNGAFVRHMRKPPYRKSRGLVFLEIMEASQPYDRFCEIGLDGIEPFTLVLFAGSRLWECRWDGSRKYVSDLDASTSHIWSSSTLYDHPVAKNRRQWFEKWLEANSRPSHDRVLDFHRSAGNGDIRNDLVINRDDRMRTVSVTSIIMTKDNARMTYNDLRSGSNMVRAFGQRTVAPKRAAFRNVAPWRAKALWWLKACRIRLTHWEYWPTHVVYGPLYFYWLWLSLKARSLFFFSAANPRIEYAGFTHERKSNIQALIPRCYYPRTHFCKAGTNSGELRRALEKMGFGFPLFAKPDIGERGRQVRLLHSSRDLDVYCNNSKVDFLVQQFIAYEQEAGIFYIRIPGEAHGRISGIVGKEFLTVTGDGRSSIRALLKRTDRFFLQLPALTKIYGDFLDTILSEGARYTLVPYGNHCRGAKFIDLSGKITTELTNAIDHVCRQIPGFYYGRLDIKFTSWEDLARGKNFSIIELNGAGSEPTHIYDPSHSLFFAWKEIIRHWRLLYSISRLNAKKKNIPMMRAAEGLKMLKDHARHLKLMEQI